MLLKDRKPWVLKKQANYFKYDFTLKILTRIWSCKPGISSIIIFLLKPNIVISKPTLLNFTKYTTLCQNHNENTESLLY